MTRLAEVEPAAWDDLLAHLGCADVYYLAEYLEGARLLEPGTPAFLHLEGDGGDIVFPLLVRTIGQLFRAHPVPVVDTHNIERAKAKGAGAEEREA